MRGWTRSTGGVFVPEAEPVELQYVGVGTASQSSGSISLSLPAGIQDNDILVMFQESGDGSQPTHTDWTPIVFHSNFGCSIGAYWHRYDSGDPPNTSISAVDNHQVSACAAFRGCPASGSPVNATAAASDGFGSSSYSITGPTTTIDGAVVCAVVALSDDLRLISSYTDATLDNENEIVEQGTSQGDDGKLGVMYGFRTTAGGGNISVSLTGTDSYVGIAFALSPQT